jgi:putative membrane protein
MILASAALLAGCATDYEAEIGSTGAGTEVTSGTATEVPSATAVDQLPTTEQDFVRETAQSGHAEIQLGKLMSDKAQNSGLKAFGQRLVDDHTKANEELAAIATQKGLIVPKEMSDEQRRLLEQVGSLNGFEFDRAAQHHAVEHHRRSIQRFEDALQRLRDDDLKAFATKTLPVLREHLTIAQALQTGTPTADQPATPPSDQ